MGEVYDLILKYRFFIVGAETLGVRHCLAAPEGAAPLERVYSHPRAGPVLAADCPSWGFPP